jgi:hypothetical protein
METKGIQQFLNSYSVKMIIVSGIGYFAAYPIVFDNGYHTGTDCPERKGEK